MTPAQPSVLPGEIEKFNALAARWWDPAGPMRALHAMNPLRTGWIDRQIARRRTVPTAILDIGCGAGLAAEAFARRGHGVLGIDAAPDAIAAAQAHAEALEPGAGPLAYRCATAETLVAEPARFPVITALELIEHVADPAAFLRLLAALLEPGGLLAISTINRTAASLAVAKLGAEYVARLLPAGTHDWRRFLAPAALARAAAAAGLRHVASAGMRYDLRRNAWRLSANLDTNYLALFEAKSDQPDRINQA